VSVTAPALGAPSASRRSRTGTIIAGLRSVWSTSIVRRSVIATGMYPAMYVRSGPGAIITPVRPASAACSAARAIRPA
jgi:hypothetical protein